jgi:hypothetical protein
LLKDARAAARIEVLMKESDFASDPAPADALPAGTGTPEAKPGK